MTRKQIATIARTFAALSAASGSPIPHAVLAVLASAWGSDWALVDGAVLDAFADMADDRRRADPALWGA